MLNTRKPGTTIILELLRLLVLSSKASIPRAAESSGKESGKESEKESGKESGKERIRGRRAERLDKWAMGTSTIYYGNDRAAFPQMSSLEDSNDGIRRTEHHNKADNEADRNNNNDSKEIDSTKLEIGEEEWVQEDGKFEEREEKEKGVWKGERGCECWVTEDGLCYTSAMAKKVYIQTDLNPQLLQSEDPPSEESNEFEKQVSDVVESLKQICGEVLVETSGGSGEVDLEDRGESGISLNDSASESYVIGL